MRCILVEFDYQHEVDGASETGTLYFSDQEFFDDVTEIAFLDCIRSGGVLQYSRSLSGDFLGAYVSSVGSLELDNADGDLDYLLDLACDGSQVRFYYGDPTWIRTDFRHIFTAIIDRVSAPEFDRISVLLKDTGLLLNKSIGGTTSIGGTGPNADRSYPANFGYVHNLQAIVSDESLLLYVHSDTGLGTSAVEVRDKGVSVDFVDNADGTFTLIASPEGTITCDVLAEPVGSDNRAVSDAIGHLVGDRAGLSASGQYYGPGPTFTPHDEDDYFVGISLAESRNVIDILSDVSESGNLFWAVLRTGEFTFGRLRLNNIEAFGLDARTITEDDIDEGSFNLSHSPTLYYRFQGYMSRNWSQQTDFATSLSPDEQAAYSRKGLYLIQDESIGTTYDLAPELYNKSLTVSPVIDTLISDAFSEFDTDVLARWMATRRVMFLPWVEVITVVVGIDYFELEIGDPVLLTLPRFGDDDGVLLQVIGIDIRLSTAKIQLKLARRNIVQDVPDSPGRINSAIGGYQPPYVIGRPYVTAIDIDPLGILTDTGTAKMGSFVRPNPYSSLMLRADMDPDFVHTPFIGSSTIRVFSHSTYTIQAGDELHLDIYLPTSGYSGFMDGTRIGLRATDPAGNAEVVYCLSDSDPDMDRDTWIPLFITEVSTQLTIGDTKSQWALQMQTNFLQSGMGIITQFFFVRNVRITGPGGVGIRHVVWSGGRNLVNHESTAHGWTGPFGCSNILMGGVYSP